MKSRSTAFPIASRWRLRARRARSDYRTDVPHRIIGAVAKTRTKSLLESALEEEMPRRLEPMLAKPGAVPDSDSDDWAYEIKWDGVRVLGYAEDGEWCMLSRRLEDVSARYPELEPIADASPATARSSTARWSRSIPRSAPLSADSEPHGPDLARRREGADQGGARRLRDLRPAPSRRALRPGASLPRAAGALGGPRPRRPSLAHSPLPPGRRRRPARGRAAPGTRGSGRQAL